MTIETKYNIGDEVWFASGGKEIEGCIEYLRMNYECARWEEDKVESYTVRGYNDILYVIEAENLFPTKEELLIKLNGENLTKNIWRNSYENGRRTSARLRK